MYRKCSRIVRLSAVIPLLSLGAAAQSLLIGADGGASKTVGRGLDNLRLGFSLALDGTYSIVDFLQVGGRYGFTNWGIAREAILQELSDTLAFADLGGSSWSMEIAPIVRATTAFPDNVVNLFAQAGAGLYIIHAETTINLNEQGQSVTREYGTGTDAHFGFSLGGGVTIGQAKPVLARVYPLWNYVVRDERPNRYWTVNAGIVFGFGK